MKKTKIRSEHPPEYGKKILDCHIQSKLSCKDEMVEKILALLQDNGFLNKEEDQLWTRLCLEEVIVNAIKHGNKEDENKKVQITLFVGVKEWAIRIEDEGSGFAEKDIPDVEDATSLELDHGRGILLMQNYMDEIWYYDQGKRVQLKKIKKNFFERMKAKFFKIFFKAGE
jgi:serine/threonine-protein kinase RsbW